MSNKDLNYMVFKLEIGYLAGFHLEQCKRTEVFNLLA